MRFVVVHFSFEILDVAAELDSSQPRIRPREP